MLGYFIVYIYIVCAVMLYANPIEQISGFRVKTWNVRGYLSSIPYLRHLLTDCDILCISEHWLHDNRHYILNDISATHYVHARSSHASCASNFGAGRGQGGVAIFWRKELSGISVVSGIIHDRVCAIRLQTGNGLIFYIFSVYMPAQGCDDELSSCLDELSEILLSMGDNCFYIVAGDFNGDIGNIMGGRNARPATRQGRIVANFFLKHDLIASNSLLVATGPIATFESHNAKTTLDYVAVSSTLVDAISRCWVSDWHVLNTSDHLPVNVNFRIVDLLVSATDELPSGRIKWEKLTQTDVERKFTFKVDPRVRQICRNFESYTLTPTVIDESFSQLTQVLMNVADSLPRTKFRKNLKPFWNADLSNLKRAKVHAYHLWVEAGRPRTVDNPLFSNYKSTKKEFMTTLKLLSKQYENDEILEVVRLAEVNRNSFWRLLQKCRKGTSHTSIAIKRADGRVVHQVEEVLDVWRNHFATLGQNKDSPNFDANHFKVVTDFVKDYNRSNISDDTFLQEPFSVKEIRLAVSCLNSGKSPGYDQITAEQVKYAGDETLTLLCRLFNGIRQLEYIPRCFRYGVQVPLFKGKDLCNLDPNNYRGITLLSTYNKLFEIVLWNRLKKWWVDEGVISDLQGACKTGLSCIHSAFSLQEAVATSLEAGNKCFVAFYDVSKAFDSVWIDGLFRQVFNSGITGKTWRLLYRSYLDFRCCAKIQGQFSEWYVLERGIHQGGYMSLLKYTLFINSLLVQLKLSGLCCKINRTPSTPVGYADDLASGCINANRLRQVMDIVYQHGCTWRYEFNARKSGVLIFGDDTPHNRNADQMREFKLGDARVRERLNYDHVGIRTSVMQDDVSGVAERIAKARTTFNAATGLGIRRNGLTIYTCNIIFWSLAVPTALYGCEIWRLNKKAIDLLESFQLYAAKKIQRFYSKVPNVCCLYALGWMRLERFVQVKKMLFIRSILVLDDQTLSRKIFCERASVLFDNEGQDADEVGFSLVSDLLNTAIIFNLWNEVRGMVLYGHRYSKQVWKCKVWDRAWNLEDVYWRLQFNVCRSLDIISLSSPDCRYLTWWYLSDKYPQVIRSCEVMARLVCHASLLKTDDVRLKRLNRSDRVCSLCDMYEDDNVKHLVMQCPILQTDRTAMFREINEIEVRSGRDILSNSVNTLGVLLGRSVDNIPQELMDEVWLLAAKHIGKMYYRCLSLRKGIG